jgi:glucose-1-phosphate thymidylyltransferase
VARLLKAVILAGGPPKKLAYVFRGGSRSLLRFPRGYLLEKHIGEVRRYFDEFYVVSDDSAVEIVCGRIDGCRFVRQKSKGVEGAICDALAAIGSHDEMVTIDYGDIYFGNGYLEGHMNSFLRSYEPTITVTQPFIKRKQYLNLDVDVVSSSVTAVSKGEYTFAGLLSAPASELYATLCAEGGSVGALIDKLARQNRLRAHLWLGEWVDIDTPWDYLLAVRLDLAKLNGVYIDDDAEVSDRAVIEPPAYIDARSRIDHYAVVKGPVYIGPRALIGAHSFIRSFTAVFEGATVGAYSEVKRSIVYAGAFVSSHCYIADSVIGEKAEVKPYTVTLNIPYSSVSREIIVTTSQPLEKLKIGAIIAAGSRTKPHMVIEPASVYE